MSHEAKWYPDPTKRHELRYFDGKTWTDSVCDKGQTASDPYHQAVAVAAGPPADPNVIWSGASKPIGVGGAAKFRLTKNTLYWDKGRMSTKSEQASLASVRDLDVSQSMTQKSRQVGRVVVHFTNGAFVEINDIPNPHHVRDVINEAVADIRRHHWDLQRQVQAAGASQIVVGQQAPAAAAGPSVGAQLKELADLRDAGVLTDDEFQTQKAKLLG